MGGAAGARSGGARRVGILACLLLLPGPLLAQSGETETTTVTVTETYAIPPDESRREAEGILRKRARRGAVEKALGVNVQVADVMMQSESGNDLFESYQRLIRNVVNGRIVDEEKPDFSLRDGNTLVARYTATVAEDGGKPDPDFGIEAGANRKAFTVGEEIELEVTPTQPAYITVFSITEDDRVSVLFPNRYMTDNRVDAHTTRTIPNRQERQVMSFALQPHLERPDEPYSELLFLVATKSDISYDRLKERLDYGSNWIELNRWLMEIPRDQWTEAYLQYQVFPD